MEDKINELLEMIGFDTNTLMVSEDDTSYRSTLFYPNHMQTKVLENKSTSDTHLLEIIQTMMEEHAMDVASDIKMIKRYRKSL